MPPPPPPVAHTAGNLDPSPEPSCPPCNQLRGCPPGSPTLTAKLWAESCHLTTGGEADPLLRPAFLSEIPAPPRQPPLKPVPGPVRGAGTRVR